MDYICKALVVDNQGKVYGSAPVNRLFRFDPANEEFPFVEDAPLEIWGRGSMGTLESWTKSPDGLLYGGIDGGARSYLHFFSYDNINGFVDLGNPEFEMTAPGIEQGIKWRGLQLGASALSEDGESIVLGEDESLSQLLFFPAIWKQRTKLE